MFIESLKSLLRRLLPTGRLSRAATLLAGGTALAQAVVVLASPVLTRLYTPADFGIFGVFTAAVMILNSIDSLRYEMAICLPADQETSDNLLVICLLLVCAFGVVLQVATLAFGNAVAGALKAPQLGPYLWLLPASVVGAGLMEALTYSAMRQQRFKTMAESRLHLGWSQIAVQVALGTLKAGTAGLILGDTAGRWIGLSGLVRGSDIAMKIRRAKAAELWRAALDYIRFPKLMSPASLLNVAALQVPFLLIPAFFGAENGGKYFLAYRVLVLPASLIGSAVGQAFWSEAASVARQRGELGLLSTNLAVALAAVYSPLYLCIMIGGPSVFRLVFGEQWAGAGTYAQILAPMTLIWAVASPLSSVLVIKDRLGESLAFTFFGLGLKLAAILIGSKRESLLLTVSLISGLEILLNAGAIFRFLRAAHGEFIRLFQGLMQVAVRNVPLLVIVGLVSTTGRPIALFTVTVVMLPLTYYLLARPIAELSHS